MRDTTVVVNLQEGIRYAVEREVLPGQDFVRFSVLEALFFSSPGNTNIMLAV